MKRESRVKVHEQINEAVKVSVGFVNGSVLHPKLMKTSGGRMQVGVPQEMGLAALLCLKVCAEKHWIWGGTEIQAAALFLAVC